MVKKKTKKTNKTGLPPRGGAKSAYLNKLFESVESGDIKQFPEDSVNIGSLRSRAGELNREAGYQKYRVSKDSLLGVVRISNGV